MPPLTHGRNLAALALAAALALPWPAAAAPQARHQPASPGLLQQLWTAVTAFWGAGVSPDDGCKMDPNGGCFARSAAPAPLITPDSGCKMDPNGGCLPGS
ncbi:MAG TPA: hypothetical protein VH988_01480 [Thermoanaerobaculia bacterium]|jgi:hypothetical protein|nr:hypothetical protein [Thermoanaerobaculia bacterium]